MENNFHVQQPSGAYITLPMAAGWLCKFTETASHEIVITRKSK